MRLDGTRGLGRDERQPAWDNGDLPRETPCSLVSTPARPGVSLAYVAEPPMRVDRNTHLLGSFRRVCEQPHIYRGLRCHKCTRKPSILSDAGNSIQGALFCWGKLFEGSTEPSSAYLIACPPACMHACFLDHQRRKRKRSTGVAVRRSVCANIHLRLPLPLGAMANIIFQIMRVVLLQITSHQTPGYRDCLCKRSGGPVSLGRLGLAP
jgi:hypothetical protein